MLSSDAMMLSMNAPSAPLLMSQSPTFFAQAAW